MAGFNKAIDKVRLVITTVCGIVLSLFLFYTAGFGQMTPMFQMAFPLLLASLIAFCAFPFSRKKQAWWHLIVDLVFFLLSIIVLGYVILFEKEIAMRIGGNTTTTDMVVSLLGLLIVVELCRRASSPILSLLALVFFGYLFVGPYIPGFFGHPGFDLEGAVIYTFMGQEGIFGSALNAMVSYIFIFILFGAVLEKTGAGQIIINFALAATGRMTGGPAMTAILASTFFGTMSGSPVANVSGTGTLTIPLMKKTGFSPNYAGSVEAVASTGGQFMPPVMGSAAFLMAEILGVPYAHVALAALLPALLYYACLYFTVYFKAKKENLRGLSKEETPKVRDVLRKGWPVFIPIAALVYLLMSGYSPGYAAFYTIVCTVVVSLLSKETRQSFFVYCQALVDAAKQSVTIFAALACVGIIVASISLSGLGVKFSLLVTQAAGQSLLLALIYVAIACIILGMGLPPIAAYLLVVVVSGPAVASLGADLFTVHMFIFYFASLAVITPPVALAAFAAAGISGGNPFKTGFLSMRLGIVAFVVPFMFVNSPELLLRGGSLVDSMYAFMSALVGVFLLASAMEGYVATRMKLWLRVIAFVGGFALIIPEFWTDVMGVMILAAIVIQQIVSKKTEKQIEINQQTA